MAAVSYGKKFFPDLNLENLGTVEKFKLHPGKRTVYLSLIECIRSFLIPKVDSISSATMPADSLHFEYMLKELCDNELKYRGGVIIDRDENIFNDFSNKDTKIWKLLHLDLFDLTESEVVDVFLPHDVIWLDLMCLFTTNYYNLIETIIKSATGTFIVAFTVYHGRGKQHCDDPPKHLIANSGTLYDIIEMSSVRYQSFSATRMTTYILGIVAKQ